MMSPYAQQLYSAESRTTISACHGVLGKVKVKIKFLWSRISIRDDDFARKVPE